MRPATGSRLRRLGLLWVAFLALALPPFHQAEAAPTPHVWLHYDYLVYPDGRSDAPDPASIQMVVDAYAARGIVLHIDHDHAAVPSPTQNVVLVGRSGDCFYTLPNGDQGLRQVVGLQDVKAQYFHPTANHEWHYALFGGNAFADCGVVYPRSGVAELNGDNLVMGMNTYRAPFFQRDSVRAVGVGFMHELGHNLGLRHGGDEDINHKPNYLSVMNYAFGDFGIPFAASLGGTIPVGRRLDYSASVLPSLDPAHLDETVGIQGGTTDITRYFVNPDLIFDFLGTGPASGPIDWNLDGTIGTDVFAGLVDASMQPSAFLPRMVRGFDDWSAVRGYILGTIQRGPKTIAHEDAAEQPQVTGLSPASGLTTGGTAVTLSGKHLRKATQVYFGDTWATSFRIVDEKTIVAVSPPFAIFGGPVHVTVVSADNPSPSVDADVFTYLRVLPIVTGVSPSSGVGGTAVTISGSNFTGADIVTFVKVDAGGFVIDERSATAFSVVDDRTIVATTPVGLVGVTHVCVGIPAGTNCGTLVAADEFRFLPPPAPPSITSIDPAFGPASGGTPITIRGSGFTWASTVYIDIPATFGGNPNASFTVIDDSTLVAISPPYIAGETIDIRVVVGTTATAWTSARTAADRFSYH